MSLAIQIEFNPRDLRRIERRLSRLKPSLQRRVDRKAVRFGLTPVRKAVKRAAPVDTGRLKKSIVSRVRLIEGDVVGLIGPDSKHFYGHFTEKGTGLRIRRDGRSTGRTPARPWLEPAAEAHSAEFEARWSAKIAELIEKALTTR